MKDDRFNELMEKYVDSTKRGKDVDLQKLRNRKEDTIKVRRGMPKYVWVACTILLVIVVSLSVSLPVLLKKDDVPQNYYCDDSQILETEVSDIAELKNKYNLDCLMPSIDFIESHMWAMTYKENNQNFGLYIDMFVFDENFDSITINVIKKPYVLNRLQYFDAFFDSIQWRNTIVRYQIRNNNDGYSYAMTFTIDNYNYFINFKSYNMMSVIEVLDLLY